MLPRSGFTVAAWDTQEEAVETVAIEIEGYGGSVIPVLRGQSVHHSGSFEPNRLLSTVPLGANVRRTPAGSWADPRLSWLSATPTGHQRRPPAKNNCSRRS